MQTTVGKLTLASIAALILLWQPSGGRAQSTVTPAQSADSPGGQVIRLRDTGQSENLSTLLGIELSDAKHQALLGMAIAIAIDEGSLADLDTAITELDCLEECGAIIDAQLLLHRAARDANPAIVERLVAAGGSINHVSPPLLWTPLLVALQAARMENATTLVALGADTTLVGLDGTSAPFLADIIGLDDLIPYPPIQLSQEDANRTLLLGIEANNLMAVRFALKAGADPGVTVPTNGWSALMIAAFNGYYDIVLELLELQYGMNRRQITYAEETGGFNALHATMIGYVDDPESSEAPNPAIYRYGCIANLLILKGIDVNTRTQEGLSASDIATNVSVPEGLMANLRSGSTRLASECQDRLG